jgi:hypothetical protein
MRRHGAPRGCAAFGAALLIALAVAPRDAGAGDSAAPAVSVRPALPEAGRIGRIRRDSAGHIVPAGPPRPAEPAAPGGLLSSSGQPGDAVGLPPPRPVPRLTSFDPQALAAVQRRADHEMQAQKLQREIDQIVREERAARAHGATLDGHGLTPREEELIRKLERIDKDVHEHELQHYLAAQPYARTPEYFEVIGPDGRRFAVSGITAFDASPIAGDAEATIRKLDSLARAALAPRAPSEEDRHVAATLEQLVALLRQTGSAVGSSTPRPGGRR